MMIRTLTLVALSALCSGCDNEKPKETSTEKVIQVDSDDAEMNAAMQKARDTFPEFWAKISADNKRPVPLLAGGMVKAYFADASSPESGEHLWISEVSYDGREISGTVASEPLELRETELGEQVSFPLDRLSDWLLIEDDVAMGAYTVQLLRGRMDAAERAEHDAGYPFSFPESE